MLRSHLLAIYTFLFSRKSFHAFNRALYGASVRGLGMLNFENDVVSGEAHFLREYLSKCEAPTVLDVGANEGKYASAVVQANRNARVFAFEPHPQTYGRLVKLAPSKAKIIAINAACGSARGRLTLFDREGSFGTTHASLHEGVLKRAPDQKTDQTIVEVLDLDTFAAEKKIPVIHLLKIDTEGHELEVLKGASTLLSEGRIKAIQFEFNEMNVVSRVFFKDFRDLLPEYKFFRMVRDGLIPLDPYSPFRCELFVFQNIVALQKELAS
jgi:FkbM family methyltransferase